MPFREFATGLLATREVPAPTGTVLRPGRPRGRRRGRRAVAAAAAARPAAGRPDLGPGGRRDLHAAGRAGPPRARLRGPRHARAGAGRATVGAEPRGLAAGARAADRRGRSGPDLSRPPGRPVPTSVRSRLVTVTAPAVRTARLSERPAQPVNPSIPPWPGEVERVRGVDLFVRRTPGPAGGGEPALYVHGLGGASTNWTDLADLLAGRLDGEALDLPGFGRSGPVPRAGLLGQPGTPARSIALLEHRGGGPVHLFGNSLGGAVAVRGRRDPAGPGPDADPGLAGAAVAAAAARLRRHAAAAAAARARAARRSGGWTSLPPERRARAVLDLCFADPSVVPAEPLPARRSRRSSGAAALPCAMDAFTASLRGLARSYAAPGERSLWRAGRPGAGADAGGVGRPGPAGAGRARAADRGDDPGRPAAGAAGRRARRPAGGPADVVARAVLGLLEDVGDRPGSPPLAE